ncbi:MAG: hypothetical protein COU40_00500 [Candidatus Moranbacteria bacterium CG10_big_fil_rev_8_21_14_0_10_35_21]|nr:MAG: hypothetical protein COU40_00500 [Candidatus Moranbacteria bacterium CG10_big_fil_rev_8_21_14_0_10_35_21]PJA88835.1 MAG: hypothetical protein CO139_00970 [Candidatus Moranbacteria bacterium CG_4_9_14_3_um_filter_36_9]
MEETENAKTKTETLMAMKFIRPQEIIDQLEIEPGMNIADFGCGPGHFSLPLAQKVAEGGMVYALDIVSQKLEAVESRAKNLGINNVIPKRANLEKVNGSGLEAISADWVIIKDILFQNKDKKIILGEAKRILKPEGKILIIEWKSTNVSLGPKKDTRISEEEMKNILEQDGFKIIKNIEAGDFHYGLVISKNNQ